MPKARLTVWGNKPLARFTHPGGAEIVWRSDGKMLSRRKDGEWVMRTAKRNCTTLAGVTSYALKLGYVQTGFMVKKEGSRLGWTMSTTKEDTQA